MVMTRVTINGVRLPVRGSIGYVMLRVSGKAPHEAFLPGFGAELELAGLQFFHFLIIFGL